MSEGVPLEEVGGPGQGTAAGEARFTELIGDRGIDVHHQRHAQHARERRHEVCRLLDRVHDVEGPAGHPPDRFAQEGHVERELAQRRPRFHAADGQARAPAVDQPGNLHRRALREGEQLDVMAVRAQRAHHGQHRQRRAPHLEEGLRGEEEDAERLRVSRRRGGSRAHAVGDSVEPGSQSSVACSPRNRSASMAAMHPLLAAVTACR